MSSLDEDINAVIAREAQLQSELNLLADDLKVDSKHKKLINEFYQARMKEYLAELNVHVLEANDYKTYSKLIKTNALGSDVPRSLLAQYVAFLQTMQKFNQFLVCPLVIDSPRQQEQDSTNEKAIFNFIFDRKLPGQQLILGTISVDGLTDVIPQGTHLIELKEKFGLLRDDQYETVNQEMGGMHKITLGYE